jgi:hypothetical protein
MKVLSSRGGKALPLSAPNYSTGEQPDGLSWSEDNPVRVGRYNAELREVGSEPPTKVFSLKVNAIVDPNGHHQQMVDDVPLRLSDGVHLTAQVDCRLAPTFLPLICQIASTDEPAIPSTSLALVRSTQKKFPDTLCHAPTTFSAFG